MVKGFCLLAKGIKIVVTTGLALAAAVAFLVSGTSLLAAHMGFVAGTEPEMLTPLIIGKLSGAFAAAALALCLG